MNQTLPNPTEVSKYHTEIVSRAKAAIDAIFGDVSVEQSVIQHSLTQLTQYIQEMQEALASHS